MPTTQIFISYSHVDKTFCDELETNLKPYLSAGSITSWSDRQIAPGSQWFPEIESALANSKIAVLLVSPDFLASDFIHEHELGSLLKKAEEGGIKILWVPVRDSAYRVTPLKNYQAVYDPSNPLARMTPADRDSAWVTVCEKVEKAVSELKTEKAISNIELKLGEQREDIQTIALLARAVFSKRQLKILQKLSEGKSITTDTTNKVYYEGFKQDILRLRGVGFIENKEERSGLSTLEELGGIQDARTYFRVTEEGRHFLALLERLPPLRLPADHDMHGTPDI
jgi:hypothetical protein